jgi:hypothetical protein
MLKENTNLIPEFKFISRTEPNPNNVLQSDGTFISLMSLIFIVVLE